MSFAIFRKYEKPLLWGVVIFSVLIFATFSGFGDLKALLTQKDLTNVAGEFDVLSSGERKRVSVTEYALARQDLNRLYYAQGRKDGAEDADVWGFLIRLAEARGADLDVAPSEVARFWTRGQPITKEEYRTLWRDRLQFPSPRDMENFARDYRLGARWFEFEVAAAGVVSADDVYLRWRQDNERFDYVALVVPDLPPDQIPEPTAEDLQTLWDDTAESVRSATYTEPRRLDVAYAWAPLGEGEHAVPAEKLAAVAEPRPEELDQRFAFVREGRWPDDVTEPTDEIRATLVRELKVVTLAQKAMDDFQASEDKSVEAFRRIMEEAGLQVQDPEGLLGTEELAALPEIGSETLPLWLAQQHVGGVHFGYPYGQQDDVHLVLVQAEQASRPLAFEEAHDKLVKNWKDARRDQAAKDFREALRMAARERPECMAAIQPLLDAAAARADEAAAALTDATDEARAARRKEVLDQAERLEIAPRVAEFEHLVWDDVPRPEGSRLVEFTGVPRSYSKNPTGEEDPASVERQLKTSALVFRLGAEAVSEPIRHAPTSQTSIVLVRARSFPPQADMLADQAGMEAARKALSSQREAEAQRELAPEALMASRHLLVAEPTQKKPTRMPEVPPDA